MVIRTSLMGYYGVLASLPTTIWRFSHEKSWYNEDMKGIHLRTNLGWAQCDVKLDSCLLGVIMSHPQVAVWEQLCSGKWIVINITIAVWWFGTLILWFSIYWECHHPNWLSYFSEGFKPPARLLLILVLYYNVIYIYTHIYLDDDG